MNPFTKIDTFLKTIVLDVTNLALTIFIIGFIICAIGVARGSEENVPRFQKGLLWTGIGVVVVVLASVIVTWIKTGVK